MNASQAGRVLRLGELLAQPSAGSAMDEVQSVVTPIDPRVELEMLRARIVAEARDAGLEEGRARARQEIDAAIKQARAEVEAGNADHERELLKARGALAAVLESLEDEIERLDQRTIDDACVLAMTALTRVVGEQVVDGQAMVCLCRQLLQEFKVRPLTISVSSGDADAVNALVLPAGVVIVVDPGLCAGDCRLNSHRGCVVTSLASRLHAIADALGLAEPPA